MALDEQDVIRIKRPQSFLDSDWDLNVVNFNYILKPGTIPDRTEVISGHQAGFYHIDWQKDDAFTRALKTIEQRSSERIQESQDLRRLLKKDQWSKADREQWEEGVSQIVAEETAKIPGFAHYRTSGNDKEPYHTDVKDIGCLNDLSSDIEHDTEKLRFDCGVESIIKGVTIQRLENSLLPPRAASPTDFKKASSYFFAMGGVNFHDDNRKPVNHASIFTPAGNTIEGTAPGYSYKRSLYPDSTLERLAHGKPFVARDGSVYDQPTSGGRPADQVRASAQRALDNGREEGRIFSRSQLWMRDAHDGTRVSEAKEDGLMIAATRSPYGVCELKIYQKQMIGTPQEGYVMIGYSIADKPNPPLSWEYQDSLTGKSYKFSAAFDRDNVQMTVAREIRSFGFDWKEDIIVQERKPLSPPATTPANNGQSASASPAAENVPSAAGQPLPVIEKSSAEKFLIMAQMRPEYRAYAHAHHFGAEPDGVWGDGTKIALEAMVRCGQIDAKTAQAVEQMYEPSGELHGHHVETSAAIAYMKQIKCDPRLNATTDLPKQNQQQSARTPVMTAPA